MPSVYLFATLDTKGAEADFVRQLLTAYGVGVTLVDVGALGEPAVAADIARDHVFALAGSSLEDVRRRADRGEAVTLAAAGAAHLAREAFAAGGLGGVLGLGGSAGTSIATAAMRALPLGVPKVMLSTLTSGTVRQFVGDKDIFMLNAVADIAGINRISRTVLSQAARAMAGLMTLPAPAPAAADRPIVAATMFGVTTPCVERARAVLERAGYEVLVFHATGSGGQAMESLVAEGLIDGVLDLTTTELADEQVGGFLSAGPDRLTAAGARGIPQVVSTGAADMVNFYAPSSVPEKFKDRVFYRHNANVTLMRTTAGESAAIGADIARKLAAAQRLMGMLNASRQQSAKEVPKEGPDLKNGATKTTVVTEKTNIVFFVFFDASVAPFEIRYLRPLPRREALGQNSHMHTATVAIAATMSPTRAAGTACLVRFTPIAPKYTAST